MAQSITDACLSVVKANAIPDKPQEERWLIEYLWSYNAVGIIGGEPKCGKSILALSIAVAVASAKPCLNHFNVSKPGRVLLYAAEDSLNVVKNRLAAIALEHNTSINDLNLYIITEQDFKLDINSHVQRLINTVKKGLPSLLILDPFVRLHSGDENASREIAPLLNHLRFIQRTYNCSVIIVHHARKDSNNSRSGQALRGSSEFHAWGDSNLYLKRNSDDSLLLTIEHRSERSHTPITLELLSNDLGPFHKIKHITSLSSISSNHNSQNPNSQNHGSQKKDSPVDKILATLTSSTTPLSQSQIRNSSNLRSQVVSDTLKLLTSNSTISYSKEGYSLIKKNVPDNLPENALENVPENLSKSLPENAPANRFSLSYLASSQTPLINTYDEDYPLVGKPRAS